MKRIFSLLIFFVFLCQLTTSFAMMPFLQGYSLVDGCFHRVYTLTPGDPQRKQVFYKVNKDGTETWLGSYNRDKIVRPPCKRKKTQAKKVSLPSERQNKWRRPFHIKTQTLQVCLPRFHSNLIPLFTPGSDPEMENLNAQMSLVSRYFTLKDQRDGVHFFVKKLKNGECVKVKKGSKRGNRRIVLRKFFQPQSQRRGAYEES